MPTISQNMLNTLAYHFFSTKASTALYTLESTGTSNSLNGSTLKVSSNPNQNPHTSFVTTNTTNGFAYSSLSMICSTLEAMTLLKKHSRNLSKTDLMSNFLDLPNGSSKCAFTSTRTPPWSRAPHCSFMLPG